MEDMAHWDDAVRSHRLVKPPTMRRALTPTKTRDGKTSNYGLGWALFPDGKGGLLGFGHDGAWGGFRTSYYFHTESGRTTVTLSNRGDFNTDGFWYPLNDLMARAESGR